MAPLHKLIPQYPSRREIPLESRHVASLYRPVECPLVRRKKGTLQEGSEVLRCCLLRAGYKAGKLMMTKVLPFVGAT